MSNLISSFGMPRPSLLHRHGGRIQAGKGVLPISLAADSYSVVPGGTIAELPLSPLGVPVMARFEGATLLVNSSKLAVAGGANYTTTAGDVVVFLPLAAGWQAVILSGSLFGSALNLTLADSTAAFGPIITTFRDTTAPGTSIVVHQIVAKGRDSAAAIVSYGSEAYIVTSATAGAHASRKDYNVASAGGIVTAATLTPTGFNSTAIGQTTPARGTFTGTPTNDNAAAGTVGEVIASTVGNVALVTATAKSITSISLTAGDWDVSGNIALATSVSTNVTSVNQSISQTNNVLDITAGLYAATQYPGGFVPGNTSTSIVMSAMHTQISLAATTTVYLVARAGFTVSACNAYGQIHARRAR